MNPDLQRQRWIRDRMRTSGLDALLCLLPHNVLMLTGYAPVLGQCFAFFPLDGDPVLLVPDSEEELARSGWVANVRVFEPSSLLQLATPAAAVEPMLAQLARERDMLGCVIGYEHAYRPFGLTSGREILRGDQVLVQLEVYLDGFWAEITRTFFVRQASREQRTAYEACLDAMERALAEERPGERAAGVDIAARSILTDRGYGAAFKHGLGHGVGFQAISHQRPPRLHPASPDFLQPGMVHNLEPAVYMERFGIRINDDVLVIEGAPERLTPLEIELDWAICKGKRTIPRPAA